MKRPLVLPALLLSCAFVGAEAPRPATIRVSVQYLALPHATLTEWLSSDADNLHAKASALTRQGKAALLETSILTCPNRTRASAESVREDIYPVEYISEGLDGSFSRPKGTIPFRGGFGSSFETRNTGITLEIEPTLTPSGRVDLRFVPEVVTLNRLDTHMEHSDRWCRADIRMPVFETWRTNTRLILPPGKFTLVSSITPKRKLPVPIENVRVLVFVRADVLPAP